MITQSVITIRTKVARINICIFMKIYECLLKRVCLYGNVCLYRNAYDVFVRVGVHECVDMCR